MVITLYTERGTRALIAMEAWEYWTTRRFIDILLWG